ncbi:MAG: hypothetical protein IKV99_01105 [Oscillospiraceae bacterium]|nr:hypothetical protein [Oscillospiraceae bacterium]
MKTCLLQTLALVLGGLALGILVFLLLFTGVLTLVPAAATGLVFFALTILLAGSGLLLLVYTLLRSERSPALADAWLCCGQTAAVGAVGTVLTGLITLLTVSLEVGLYIGAALTVFFLFLLLGGLLCLARRYVTVRFGCGC